MGHFASNEVGTLNSVYNYILYLVTIIIMVESIDFSLTLLLSFSSQSNFVMSFHVRGWISDYKLGKLQVIPLEEVLKNQKQKKIEELFETYRVPDPVGKDKD